MNPIKILKAYLNSHDTYSSVSVTRDYFTMWAIKKFGNSSSEMQVRAAMDMAWELGLLDDNEPRGESRWWWTSGGLILEGPPIMFFPSGAAIDNQARGGDGSVCLPALSKEDAVDDALASLGVPPIRALLAEAFECGFCVTGEGWNGETPFDFSRESLAACHGFTDTESLAIDMLLSQAFLGKVGDPCKENS